MNEDHCPYSDDECTVGQEKRATKFAAINNRLDSIKHITASPPPAAPKPMAMSSRALRTETRDDKVRPRPRPRPLSLHRVDERRLCCVAVRGGRTRHGRDTHSLSLLSSVSVSCRLSSVDRVCCSSRRSRSPRGEQNLSKQTGLNSSTTTISIFRT